MLRIADDEELVVGIKRLLWLVPRELTMGCGDMGSIIRRVPVSGPTVEAAVLFGAVPGKMVCFFFCFLKRLKSR